MKEKGKGARRGGPRTKRYRRRGEITGPNRIKDGICRRTSLR